MNNEEKIYFQKVIYHTLKIAIFYIKLLKSKIYN